MTTRSSYSRSIEKRERRAYWNIHTTMCPIYTGRPFISNAFWAHHHRRKTSPTFSRINLILTLNVLLLLTSSGIFSIKTLTVVLLTDGRPSIGSTFDILFSQKFQMESACSILDNVCMKRWALLGDDWG